MFLFHTKFRLPKGAGRLKRMLNKSGFILLSLVFTQLAAGLETRADSPPVPPVFVGGTVMLGGIPVDDVTGAGYTFAVNREDGQSILPPPVDRSDENNAAYYLIEIPAYNAASQPDAPAAGEILVILVFKDGQALEVDVPSDGIFTMGASGATLELPLSVVAPAVDPDPDPDPDPPDDPPDDPDTPPDTNHPPTADAGPDQTVAEGEMVTLDGSASTDPDAGDQIAAYQWLQVVGSLVRLSSGTVARPTFTAPSLAASGGRLTFRLTVSDTQGAQDADSVTVTIQDPGGLAPAADAGSYIGTAFEGETVVLDGTGSTDGDGSIAAYQWRQVSGTSVTLADAGAVRTTFVVPAPAGGAETLVFELTVTDDQGLTGSDQIDIGIVGSGIEAYPDADFRFYTDAGDALGIKADNNARIVALAVRDPAAIDEKRNRPQNFPYGLLDFTLKLTASATRVDTVVYLPQSVQAGYRWFKYDAADGWQDFSAHAAVAADGRSVTLTLEDGGPGDGDGTRNGFIVDPSGLALPAENDSDGDAGDGSSSSGGGGTGCFIGTLPGCRRTPK